MKGVYKHMNIKWLLKRIGAVLYDNRSNIEFAAGTIMVVAGTGMVISKAEKAVEVKNEYEYQAKMIELKDENDDWDSKSQRTRDCLKVGKDTAIGYLKVYGPGLAVEVGGLALMGISHATDRKEIATVSAALASTVLEFANYRQRVVEEQGEAKDEEYLTGQTQKKSNKKKKEDEEPVKIDHLPDHSFIFDETNDNFEKDAIMNRDFLEDHEHWLNEKLWKEGFLMENDIRRDVGAPIDPNAVTYGITAVDENGNRNYISFGIDRNTERARAFREGRERSFLVILNNMEPNILKKLYRLNKYHKDIQIEG